MATALHLSTTMPLLAVLSVLSFLTAAHAEFNVVRHVSLVPHSKRATVLPPAEFSVPFTAKAPRRSSKKKAFAALRGKLATNIRGKKAPASTAVIDGSDSDYEYLTNVTIGGQHFSLNVDTGSSDTWVPQKGFSCFDLEGNPVSPDTCAFGTAGFDTKASKTFQPFPNVSFNTSYSDGEFLLGTVGFDTVTIGELSVVRQEIGVPTMAAWEGDGINSGILGLAFADLTAVYNTTDPTKATMANQLPYSPWFLSAVSQHKIQNPFFSIALDRGTFEQEENDSFDPNLGFLSFGGIAPVPVVNTAITVPIEGYSVTDVPSNGPGSKFLFYTVNVEAYTFPGSNLVVTANNNTVLDTSVPHYSAFSTVPDILPLFPRGTTVNYLPTDVAAAYNAQFSPTAQLDPDLGLYVVDCNATVPEFGVVIHGETFSIDARDQILPTGTDDNGNTICITGTQDGGPEMSETFFVLGDVFLHNVVSTFNPVAKEVTLTQRAKY
ncbi:aspartic peptidase domain-containing protein [Mycena capillaripes]|nr:aspartic peptidase domain-containing protein [Mycena capillaripes]